MSKNQKIDLNSYFTQELQNALAYPLAGPPCQTKLDQNECADDLPLEIKKKISSRLESMAWNRYPSGFTQEIDDALIRKYNLKGLDVLTAPGSNLLLHILFDSLLPSQGDCIVAQPSFVVYEDYLKKKGIPYLPWRLSKDLEFDLENFPTLKPRSIVVMATPNNPAGNDISLESLDHLLTKNPQALFIIDEAYFEFAGFSYLPLFTKHSHLILVRTFSKALGLAGLRIGYAIAKPDLIANIKKMRLPFLLNHWQIAACHELLNWPKLDELILQRVQNCLKEKKRVQSALANEKEFIIKETQANFLLLRFHSNERCQEIYLDLLRQNVSLRNVSAAPGMTGCLRLTIGSVEDNQNFLDALSTSLS